MKPIGQIPDVSQGPAPADWAPILVGLALLSAAILYVVVRGVASADFRSGLLLGIRGLLGKEIRSRSRGWRPVWLLTVYLLLLTLGVSGFLALASRVGGVVSPNIGMQLFSTLAIGSVMLLAFITPALTAGAVSGERERRTLDLLLVTRASALGLATGKLLGAVFYILFLLIAALPAYALVFLFGGVPPLYLAMAVAVGAVTGVTYAALSLLLSALVRRTLATTVLSYLVVLMVVLVLPFVGAVAALARQGQMGGAAGMPALYMYASPLLALSSVLPAGSTGLGMPLVGDLMRVIVGGGSMEFSQPLYLPITQTLYLVSVDSLTGQPVTAIGWAAWVYFFLYGGVFVALALFLSSLALSPIKPWRRARK